MIYFNRIVIIMAVTLTSITACSDDNTEDITPTSPAEAKNEYLTGVDLSKSYLLTKSLPTFENETFHALGYGYDVTGKYAHPDWIRKKVIDPQKFEDDHYDEVMHHWKMFYHRGLGTLIGTEEEVKLKLLEELKLKTEDTQTDYRNAFKGIFKTPFENDTTYTDLKYYYAIDAFVSSWYEHHFLLFSEKDLLPLRNYLTDEFKADLESKSAKEIIKLYGTHVMVDIEVGWRQDFYYRTSSKDDLQRRMVYASGQFLKSTPGIFVSPDSTKYYEKENIYSEYVSGVSPVSEPNAWMFDITNYDKKLKFETRENKIENKTLVLVNWGDRSRVGPIVPIYEFISDANKREALKQAYIEYLSK